MEFDRSSFLRAVMDRTGITQPWRAERAVEVTLETVGARIADADRARVARLVGEPLGTLLTRRSFVASEELEDLLADVSRAESVPAKLVIEHVGPICSLLAERLPSDALTALRTHLPPAVAGLFAPRGEISAPPARVGKHTRSRAISEAHAASAHPLFESRPEQAHAESVARSDAPHADTKVSSARGLTQDREHESLAEGRPGSDDPLGETGD